MAGLRLLALAVICIFVAVASGQDANRLGGDLNMMGYVWADLFTDGTTVITGGDITATSLHLTGDLTAGDTTVHDLQVDDLRTADLTAADATFSQSLNTAKTRVHGDATFEDDLTVEGTLMANMAYFGDARVDGALTVNGETNVEGVVFAQQNVQVSADLNVGQNARLFGDVLANLTLTVEDMLTVNGASAVEDWMVKGMTEADSLNVRGEATFGSLWSENVSVNDTVSVGGWLIAEGNAVIGGDISATDATILTYTAVQGNATVDGWLSAASGSTNGNFDSMTYLKVDGDLSVGVDADVGTNFTVMGDAYFGGDLTGSDSVMGVAGVFATLDVDTSSIESLTSTFITAGTLESHDATVMGTFVVTGMSTLNTLTVTGSTLLDDQAEMQTLYAGELGYGATTAGALEVTDLGVFTTVDVKTMLTVGEPSQEMATAAFESIFADTFKILDLYAENGLIYDINGDSLTTTYLNATRANVDQFASEWAGLNNLWSETGNITEIQGGWANITVLTAVNTTTESLWAVNGTLTHLWSDWIWTDLLHVGAGQVTRGHAVDTIATVLGAMDGTVDYLWSTTATIETLTSTNATVETLQSRAGTIDNLWGEDLTYAKGTIADLTSERHWSERVSVRDGFDTTVLYANYGNITNAEVVDLRVTDMAWIQEAIVREDAMVEGFTSLQAGFIAGPSVVAALTVVGDTVLSTVSVTGPAFLTELEVKRVTTTDSFDSNASDLGDVTTNNLRVEGDASVTGKFFVGGDSALDGNLVVEGTTQFQTGSFTRIGTAIITTTDMEAFNMDVANGLFGAITTDDLVVNRAARFQRTVTLSAMRGSTTGSSAVSSSIAPQQLYAYYDGVETSVLASTVFHTGIATVDALSFTSSTDHTESQLRITADGAIDFLGGYVEFDSLDVDGGIIFENENNVAWATAGAIPTANLSPGERESYYAYEHLVDRDMVPPGSFYDPSRFAEPGMDSDLLTLNPGQYRVSGNTVFAFTSPASANSMIVALSGVNGYEGTDSTGANVWTTDCVATFNSIGGSFYGGSCFFDDVITVPAGQTVTLRTWAEWRFTSAALTSSLRVDPRSTILVEEFFERISEGL